MASKRLSVDQKQVIIKVYNYFKSEADRGRLRIKVSDYARRTEDIFKISRRSLNRMVSKGKSDANNNEKNCETRGRKEKLDYFQKDLIKRSVYKFYERNEMIIILFPCKWSMKRTITVWEH